MGKVGKFLVQGLSSFFRQNWIVANESVFLSVEIIFLCLLQMGFASGLLSPEPIKVIESANSQQHGVHAGITDQFVQVGW